MEEKGVHEKHEFALFFERLPAALKNGDSFLVQEEELVHRMVHVLRMHAGERVLFFSRETVVLAEITDMQKRQIAGVVLEKRVHVPLTPEISWYLPLVDREAFDTSISVLTSLGASAITPVITEKSSQKLHRSNDRLERVMIAAAEQSKQFVFPKINDVVPFSAIDISSNDGESITLFFDPTGIPAFEIMEEMRVKQIKKITCFVGPEGDLTDREKDFLQQKGVKFCALTPTILRVEQAILVGMGMMRSLCR